MPLFLESGQTGSAAEINAANGISVGLINNMPDAALDATARQFTNLLDAAAPNLAVVLKLFALPGVPRADAASRTLAQKYCDISELWDTPLDGLIVTGTEPRAANLMDEPYWETLSKVVDWSRDNTASTIWSCLAAHAAVLHADGIVRRARDEKQLGVFDCRRVTAHPMTQHFPEFTLGSAFAPQRFAGRGACLFRLQNPHALCRGRRRYVRAAGRQFLVVLSGPSGIRGRLRCSANIAATPSAFSTATASITRRCRATISTNRPSPPPRRFAPARLPNATRVSLLNFRRLRSRAASTVHGVRPRSVLMRDGLPISPHARRSGGSCPCRSGRSGCVGLGAIGQPGCAGPVPLRCGNGHQISRFTLFSAL